MSLAKKILNVMRACRSLTYDSNNDEVGYKYVSAAKVNAAVNAALVENGIATVALSTVKKVVETENGEFLATVEVEIRLIDTESEEFLLIRGAGQGIAQAIKRLRRVWFESNFYEQGQNTQTSSDFPVTNTPHSGIVKCRYKCGKDAVKNPLDSWI